ncbi:MAG: MBL fold metallo-hydrolase [Candidatus Syntrophosphaera sp.]
MRFILLGTASGMPELTKSSSSLYVETRGKNLLFDCGEGTSQKLLKHHLDGDTLDALFISHYHPDHVSGLFTLLQMLQLQKRGKPLQLFLPERPAAMVEALEFLYVFPKRFPFPLQIHECSQAELHHEEVVAAVTDHLFNYEDFLEANQLPNQMNSYAFKITSGEGNLVYTSDIATTDQIMPIIRDSHTVIADALHPEPEQILKLQYAGVRRVLLTHGISDELSRILSEEKPPMFEFAIEDHEYSI